MYLPLRAPGVEVVGQAGGGAEAAEMVAGCQPDVVLMDPEMPEVAGIEATRRALAARPGTQVVVLTSFSDRERILRALDAGAVGDLLKDATPAGAGERPAGSPPLGGRPCAGAAPLMGSSRVGLAVRGGRNSAPPILPLPAGCALTRPPQNQGPLLGWVAHGS